MSLHRYAAKRDESEQAIVAALKAVGREVTRISGAGAPDLLVRVPGAAGGLCQGLEVKSLKGKQRESQKRSQWPIVRTVEDALQVIGVRR